MKNILFIEDDPVIARVFGNCLKKAGYRVQTCSDGQSGFYHIQEFTPDAVLLDLMLPKMNGMDILKKIRAQRKFISVPILVFTNAYLPNMIREAFSAGASQVFNKATLTPGRLVDSLHRAINGEELAAESHSGGPPATPAPSGGTGVVPQTPASSPGMGIGPSGHSQGEVPGSPPPPCNLGYNDIDKGSSPAAAASPSPRGANVQSANSTFDAEHHQAFVTAKAETLGHLRRLLHDFLKTGDAAAREPLLLELYRKVHALTASSGIAGFVDIAQMSAALEVLLKDLLEQPKHVNSSTSRTVTQSVELIGELFDNFEPHSYDLAAANILVVDDEILSRRAIVYALERANLKSISIEDPTAALHMVTEDVFDLIILDAQMPALDGFELCRKIRALPTNKSTPVLFVTSLTDFKSRAKSTMCGGTDFIAKPFLLIELSVKAIALLLRQRLFLAKSSAA